MLQGSCNIVYSIRRVTVVITYPLHTRQIFRTFVSDQFTDHYSLVSVTKIEHTFLPFRYCFPTRK